MPGMGEAEGSAACPLTLSPLSTQHSVDKPVRVELICSSIDLQVALHMKKVSLRYFLPFSHFFVMSEELRNSLLQPSTYMEIPY